MNPMKRIGLMAVFAAAVGLLGSAPARADASELLNVGDEPLATGHVSFGALKLVKLPPDAPPPYPTWWEQKITISCRNLTPGATYRTTAGTFTADRNGNGKVSGWVSGDPTWRYVYVQRLNADGSWTMVLEYFEWVA
jgi:hypothetical protein